MPVITFSREMGSGGSDIAQAVAERLGLRLAGREIINQAAIQAGVPEVALAEIDELGLLGMHPRPAALRLYRETAADLIGKLAGQGNLLFIGRAGQVILGGRPGVLHVRVIAPRSMRIERVQTHCHVSPEVATALVDASDRSRAAYLRRHYRVRWDDPSLFDLVLNMSQITIPAAVELVCLAAQSVTRAGTEIDA
jgi:cytidylate kinase